MYLCVKWTFTITSDYTWNPIDGLYSPPSQSYIKKMPGYNANANAAPVHVWRARKRGGAQLKERNGVLTVIFCPVTPNLFCFHSLDSASAAKIWQRCDHQ